MALFSPDSKPRIEAILQVLGPGRDAVSLACTGTSPVLLTPLVLAGTAQVVLLQRVACCSELGPPAMPTGPAAVGVHCAGGGLPAKSVSTQTLMKARADGPRAFAPNGATRSSRPEGWMALVCEHLARLMNTSLHPAAQGHSITAAVL